MRTCILIALFTLACTFATARLPADESKAPAKQPSAAELAKLAQPGAEHEQLAKYAGTWDVTITMGAGAAAITYSGKGESRMTVGGRFLQIEYQTKGKAGESEGIFTLGFDSRHGRHSLIAMDSFGNYFVTSQGKRDEKTGKLKLLGVDDDPLMKAMKLTKEFAHLLDLRSADEFAIEVWFVDTRTAARKEFKYMDYVFKRKK